MVRFPAWILISVLLALFLQGCSEVPDAKVPYSEGKPYTRWWWFADVIRENDIAFQLDWVKANGFGGVEIAFIYPVNRDPSTVRTPWLSTEWTDRVTFAKQYAEKIGIGCDFTFGTLWPFGGSFVDRMDAARIYGDTAFRQPLFLSWTHPDTGIVLNHMNRKAFYRYADVMGEALRPALKGSTSALFCDSWEVETRRIWTDGFEKEFFSRFGYDIRPYMPDIYSPEYAKERYDYMKLVADYVLNEFFIPFTEVSHSLGATSRVQCAGSPTDLIEAYSVADIPETEAMLYEPNFSKIVVSSAALAGKNIISAEAFTCLYGHPDVHLENENIFDLKLVADALFANGVNQIVWHGMPYNSKGIDTVRFYASVHVGEKGSLSPYLLPFNEYLTNVSLRMRAGKTYSDVAVYLPLEDSWIKGEYPEEKQMKWSWGAYELRYLHYPTGLEGYPALWINQSFLKRLVIKGNRAEVGDCSFSNLCVDAKYLDMETLSAISELANNKFPVIFLQKPRQAGKKQSDDFSDILDTLLTLPTVYQDLTGLKNHKPLISGPLIPEFWCRETPEGLILFIAHPAAKNLTLPISYGMDEFRDSMEVPVVFNWKGQKITYTLNFEPCQSLIIKLTDEGEVEMIHEPTGFNKNRINSL